MKGIEIVFHTGAEIVINNFTIVAWLYLKYVTTSFEYQTCLQACEISLWLQILLFQIIKIFFRAKSSLGFKSTKKNAKVKWFE